MPKKEEVEIQPWDKKKVLIAVLSILVVIFASLYVKDQFFPNKTIDVKGAYTKASTLQQDQEIQKASDNFQNKLDEIKSNVENLNAVDVATSTPQVQKVLNDIRALKDLPRDQARQACENICSGL